MRGEKGFTLLELIVVVAVLGILLVLAVGGLIGWRESERLREGQSELAQVLEQARTLARRYSVTYRVSVRVPGAYLLEAISVTGGVLGDLPRRAGQLPSGVRLSKIVPPSANVVRYEGSSGRFAQGVVTVCYGLELASSVTAPHTQINLLGLTGKVVSRAVERGGTPCA